jgi:ubiquinone/menaquinone biosynthesis C-methylase UbiE
MAGDNSEQIAEWNGAVGQRWASEQTAFDNLTRPFGDAALKAAAARPGERVIDIGCGCGDTSLSLGKAVGPDGSVLGVDVSGPMLEVARSRAKAEGANNVTFEQADASNAPLFHDRDLLFSRFGVMFFAAPVPAFAHLRRALKDSGRLAFVCWQGPRENPWAIVPVMAVRVALQLEGAPADPYAPGPFAFGDPNRVRAILLEANFKDVEAESFETLMPLGRSPRAAAEESVRLGPVSRLARELGDEHLPIIHEAVEKALEQFAAKDGSVSLSGRTWIVTAKAG